MYDPCGAYPHYWELIGFYIQDEGSVSCIRPDGHQGPHLISDGKGRYLTFEIDLECDCEWCQSNDSDGWCSVTEEVDPEVAEKLINSRF